MDPTNICHLNGSEVLEIARSFVLSKEYGKSCSCYMFLFCRVDTSCLSYKQEFLFTFKKWVKKLILMGKLLEFTQFMETVFETCQLIKIDIAICAAQVLYKNSHIYHAVNILNICKNENDLRVTDFIERLNNILVEKWHFRMLNDKKRNSAYALTLQHAFDRGHRSVLDIGSGTGLLSILSRRAGFEKIVSCEKSDVLCHIQNDVLEANKEKKYINLLQKMSTNIKFGTDIKDRASLIVTEIFDCALLGEGAIATLKHAWTELLDCEKLGEVIPHSATVYGICIECEEIRKHAKYSYKNILLCGNQDTCDEAYQPYTSENMRTIKGGYKELSDEFLILNINFNSIEELNNLESNLLLNVDVLENGIFDAVMVYFTLNLDETISISTKPDQESCWEQAVYTNHNSPPVKLGTAVSLSINIMEECIFIQFKNEEMDIDIGKHTQINEVMVLDIDRRLVARHNDCEYFERYEQCISRKLHHSKEALNICFICADVSVIPLLASHGGDNFFTFIEPSNALLKLLLHVDSSLNKKIQVLTRPMLYRLHEVIGLKKFDLVVSEPIDCNGLIKDNFIEDMVNIKLVCSNETEFIPSKLDCIGLCISSGKLVKKNQVADDEATLGLKIAEHMNKFKVSTHPDIEGVTLEYQLLSTSFLCFQLDLSAGINNKKELDLFMSSENHIEIKIENDGSLTGVLFWFNMSFGDQLKLSSAPSIKTHFHQTCFILPSNPCVSSKDTISLLVSRYKNFIDVRYVSKV
ncbi:protein arginine N-methyltransferase 9 isoform X3 [Hydra vulgaris]|uniref:Protein arginine N-methyltransferase 9 isoform X3 n=1 Tax=Hydra vulgaris TaxID=6087 RepID=A0ABM4D951_HYDVU